MVDAKNEKIKIKSNLDFHTKFHGNSSSVNIQGGSTIDLGLFGEQYIFDKPTPDLWVKNMILGTKREPWDGEIVVSCAKTGLKAKINWKEEGWYTTNYTYCTVTKENNPNPLFLIKGIVGDIYYISKPNATEFPSMSLAKDDIFLDMKNVRDEAVQYLPEECWDERSSLKVWKDVGKEIDVNDMKKADAAKILLEDAQRKRRNENRSFKPTYFVQDTSTGFWDPLIDSLSPLIKTKKEVAQDDEKLIVKKLQEVEIKEDFPRPDKIKEHKSNHKKSKKHSGLDKQ